MPDEAWTALRSWGTKSTIGARTASLGRICRLENVLIAHNKVYRAPGRGIYIQNDNIGNTQTLNIAQMQTYQSYARNDADQLGDADGRQPADRQTTPCACTTSGGGWR
jgi:hypothetical protein